VESVKENAVLWLVVAVLVIIIAVVIFKQIL